MRPAPPTNKGRTFPAHPLTKAEVRALLAAIPSRNPNGLRLRALVATLYGSAVRVSEALALMPSDVDDATVRVRDGKGGRARTVGLDDTCADVLGRWLDRRPALGLTGRHPIFACYSVGSVGNPMDSREVRRALARAGEKAGIAKRVHPHGLRHSLAFQLANDGVPL
ncbi:MAG: tyrosine-type recombinase/integrase, partial [Phycisphaerales bacterium]